jgi:hypothetical protein
VRVLCVRSINSTKRPWHHDGRGDKRFGVVRSEARAKEFNPSRPVTPADLCQLFGSRRDANILLEAPGARRAEKKVTGEEAHKEVLLRRQPP